MFESILICGAGGQGILLAGTVLAQAGMNDGKKVSYFPSYGAEIRGGTAHCTVIIADTDIGSPIVLHPKNALVLNQQSFDRFESMVSENALIVYNASLISDSKHRESITYIPVPATTIAENEMGEKKVANMIMLGTLVRTTHIVSEDSFINSLHTVFKGKNNVIELNIQAFKKGYNNHGIPHS